MGHGLGTSDRSSPDPFDRAWVAGSLGALAAAVDAGTPLAAVQDELFELLWPWARRHADRVARRLPPGADADETRSALLLAFWESTRRFDPGRWGAWPSLLRQRLRGARVDAARRDDALTRRHRAAVVRADWSIAQLEQERGRALTAAEQHRVLLDALGGADRSRPRGWFGSSVDPLTTDAVATEPATGPDPGAVVADIEVATAIRRWIEHDLPRDLSDRLRRWWDDADRCDPLPARLVDDLAPYLYRVVDLLDPVA